MNKKIINKKITIRSVSLFDDSKILTSMINNSSKAFLQIVLDVNLAGYGYIIGFELLHINYGCLFTTTNADFNIADYGEQYWKIGQYAFLIEIPTYLLRSGEYYIKVAAVIPNIEVLDNLENFLYFTVEDKNTPCCKLEEDRKGIISPILPWKRVS